MLFIWPCSLRKALIKPAVQKESRKFFVKRDEKKVTCTLQKCFLMQINSALHSIHFAHCTLFFYWLRSTTNWMERESVLQAEMNRKLLLLPFLSQWLQLFCPLTNTKGSFENVLSPVEQKKYFPHLKKREKRFHFFFAINKLWSWLFPRFKVLFFCIFLCMSEEL